MRLRYSLVVVLTVAAIGGSTIGSAVRAEQQAAARSPAASMPRLEHQTFTLENGLKIIFSQDKRLPMVAVNLWYHVGPANEIPGRTGFAHLFEHMMFQGSKHVAADTHFKLLEAAGASDINGTTDFDRTNYFETVPANQLELALWIESDRMGYLLDVLDQKALANQRDVVRNERRQSVENQPYGVAEEALYQAIYPAGASLPRRRDRLARRPRGRPARRRAAVLPAVLRAQQRQPGDRRRLRSRGDSTARREVLRQPQARTGRAEDRRDDAADHRRETAHRHRHRAAAARLHVLADAGDFQTGRRRGGSGRRHSRRRQGEPPVQGPGLRQADRPGRAGHPGIADPRIEVHHPGDGAPGTHRRGAGGGHQRRAPAVHRAGARRLASSSAPGTRSKRGSSRDWRRSAASAARRIA